MAEATKKYKLNPDFQSGGAFFGNATKMFRDGIKKDDVVDLTDDQFSSFARDPEDSNGNTQPPVFVLATDPPAQQQEQA